MYMKITKYQLLVLSRHFLNLQLKKNIFEHNRSVERIN